MSDKLGGEVVGGGGGGGFFFFFFLSLFVSTSLSLAGNSSRLSWVRSSSRKSSATRPSVPAVFPCVQTMDNGCHYLGFLTSAQINVDACDCTQGAVRTP